MNTKKVALVIVDISGYTQFIRSHKMSAIHAEEIIFDLLETVIDRADYPLTLNKLEGDAAFLYAEMGGASDAEVARDVARQAQGFFKAFYARAQSLSRERADCDCSACQRILDLKLKAVLHLGEAFFKTIRQFEELAGEDVILVHQLLKNSIPSDEYILTTEAFYALVGRLPEMTYSARVEQIGYFGAVTTHVFTPHADPV